MRRELACIIFLMLVQLSSCMISTSRVLIEGSITAITPDLVRTPPQDRVPYIVALALCEEGVDGPKPTTIICGASLIHPNFALTAGTYLCQLCLLVEMGDLVGGERLAHPPTAPFLSLTFERTLPPCCFSTK
jgi:hypothetical protein